MQPMDVARELDLQREPLRRLAAALLGDAHGAEDVVQEAFAAALARGERPAGLATWLRAVVRRLALDRKRRTARRAARESHAARAETQDEVDSLERLELVESLAREVRALDEPFRTALRLRYFDGLPPREIAARLGVSLATVESRLVRALEQKRLHLDRRGGRERWLAATTAWLRPTQVPWLEVLIMKTAVKVGLTAAVLLLAWWGWTRLPSSEPISGERVLASSRLDAPAKASVPTRAEGDQRHALESLAPTATLIASAPVAHLAGIVVDEEGSPLADVEIGALSDGEQEVRLAPRAKSAADGRFEIDEPMGAGSLRALGQQWFTLGAPPFGPRALPCDRVVCVVPREALEGIVVDRDGAPLEGVRVEIALFGSLFELPISAPDLLSFSRAAVSGRDGKYRIEDAPVAEAVQVNARRRGSAYEYRRGLADLRAQHGRIVFHYGQDQAQVLHGEVVDENNRPIEGAWIDVGPKDHQRQFPMQGFVQLRSDAHGTFEFPIDARESDVVMIVAASGRMSETVEPQGSPTLPSSWPSPLVIRLDRHARTLRGRVLDEQGRPLPNAWVDMIDGTPWGFVQRVDETLEPVSLFTWEALAAGRDWTQHVAVDAEGRFELGELAERTYRLVAFDERSLHSVLSEPIAAGTDDVDLVIDTASNRERIGGRVIDSSGAAVPGARITLGAIVPLSLDAAGQVKDGTGLSLEVIADQDGHFEFRGMSAQADQLSVEPPATRWFPCYGSLAREHDLEHIMLVLPRVTFVQLELSDEALGSDGDQTFVMALDERGRRVANSLGGMSITMNFSRAHTSGVFPIPDTARFLVLRPGQKSELRIPVELETGRVNVIRR